MKNLLLVVFLATITSDKVNAGLVSLGKSCLENSDCRRGLACDIRKRPATFTCLVTYGGTCNKNFECVNGLTCYKGKCSCEMNTFYDSERNDCIQKQKFGQTCLNEHQCEKKFICSNQGSLPSNLCLLDQYEICSKDSECANQLKCLSGKCNCVKGYEEYAYRSRSCEINRYLNEKNHCFSNADCKHYSLACDNSANGNRTFACARTIGEFCQDSNDCVNGLKCIYSSCQCDSKTQFYDYESHNCFFKRSFREICSLNYQCADRLLCDLKKSLTCLKSHGSQCKNNSDCANYLDCIDGQCGCAPNNYYSVDLQDCLPQQEFGKPCKSDNNCMTNLACDKNYAEDKTQTCSYLPGVRCTANSDCVNSVKCIRGFCTCPPKKFFNPLTNECEKYANATDMETESEVELSLDETGASNTTKKIEQKTESTNEIN